MYLARLRVNRSRIAVNWLTNPYRVHQRLKMAFEGDARLLFRIEETSAGTQIIVQSHTPPDWEAAFDDFPVLRCPPEHKPFEPCLEMGRRYRFCLLANPTVKRQIEENGDRKGKRQGLLREADQQAWLARKINGCGADLVGCRVASRGLQRSRKNPYKSAKPQTHLAVLFEGVLEVKDPEAVAAALATGIGPAKGYGFGLLSLAPVS